jgi:arginine:pyruvate transaminase
MRFSSLLDRIGGPSAAAWDIHYDALARFRRGEDVILLSQGDPDFDSPPAAVEAAIDALRTGDTHYVELTGRPELRTAIARQHAQISGQAVGPENVIFLAGAQNALAAASLALLEPGDEAIVPEPMYLTYAATIGLPGARLVPVAQPLSRGLRLDPQALAAAVTPRTRAIFFATPNNPSGVAMTREELEAVARIAIEHDLWVVADEVYATLVFDRPHVSIAGLAGMAERTVTVSSLSKSHAMTGWRAGWIVGPRPLVAELAKLSLCMLYGLPGFVQAGALAALEQGEAEADAMRAAYRRRRDLMAERLSAVQGLRPLLPEAGMFMLVDISATGLSSEDFAWRLYRETGVSVLDASAFGPSLAGCVRLSFAASEARLVEAAERIRHFVGALMESVS